MKVIGLVNVPPHPHNFYTNLDELQDSYFQKVGRYVPPDPAAQLVVKLSRLKHCTLSLCVPCMIRCSSKDYQWTACACIVKSGRDQTLVRCSHAVDPKSIMCKSRSLYNTSITKHC